jgi:pyrroloquinoline quinone (PQQ) biosynthesis protein C
MGAKPSTQEGKKHFIESIMRCNGLYQSKLVRAIADGSFPKRKLPILAEQVYLQEKWPSHIAHVYLKFDERSLNDRILINYIISIIRAENLGVGSKGIPHIDLVRRFAQFTGVADSRLDSALPTVQNRTLMDWCDMSALERPWIEGFAVHIACESQVTAMAKIARGLKLHYGAREDDVLFWTVHGGPLERKHSREGLAILANHTSKAVERDVLYSYEMSCKLLCEFYDSIQGD